MSKLINLDIVIERLGSLKNAEFREFAKEACRLASEGLQSAEHSKKVVDHLSQCSKLVDKVAEEDIDPYFGFVVYALREISQAHAHYIKAVRTAELLILDAGFLLMRLNHSELQRDFMANSPVKAKVDEFIASLKK